MNKRTQKQALDYLMGDGAAALAQTCKNVYDDEVRNLIGRLDYAPTRREGEVIFPQTGIKDWMMSALDEINDKFGDPAIGRAYLEHANPEVRLIYVTYAWTAMEFAKSLRSLADCIVRRDVDGVAYEAFRAGSAFGDLDLDLLAKRKQRASIERANVDKRIASREVKEVKSLNFALETDIPKPSPRYREIAERLEIKPDRVRYIIEGPRRKKK